MYDVISLGELLIDFACIGQDAYGYPTMQAHPGGAVANFLGAVAKFGGRTALLGKVGNDAFGKLLLNTLRENKIDVSGMIETDEYFTTLAFVTFGKNGERDFSFSRKPGADTQYSVEELDPKFIADSKVFHFGTLSLTDPCSRAATKKAIEIAEQNGCILSLDPNLRPPLWNNLSEAKEQILWAMGHADILKISDNEVEFLFGDISPEAATERILNEFKPSLVYLTMGSKGCFYRTKNCSGFVPALTGLKVVDTTGAGDIFGGSAMFRFLQFGKKPGDLTDAELREIVTFATCAAGLSVTKPGGISGIPELQEVLRKVSEL